MSNSVTDDKTLEGHGLRLFQLYALFGTPSDNWDLDSPETQDALSDHIDFLRKLEASGVMFMGGPFRAPDYEWDGSGVVFARANSLADAVALSERDPLFKAGFRTYEVRGWQLNEGTLNVSIELDSNKVVVT